MIHQNNIAQLYSIKRKIADLYMSSSLVKVIKFT